MIYFDITGNGTAYCIPSNPTIGETFEFFAIPYDSDVFEDVTFDQIPIDLTDNTKNLSTILVSDQPNSSK